VATSPRICLFFNKKTVCPLTGRWGGAQPLLLRQPSPLSNFQAKLSSLKSDSPLLAVMSMMLKTQLKCHF